MSVDSNWARWIFSSLAKYLREVATDNEIPAFVEGVEDRTDAVMEASSHVEIAITGPFSREASRGYYILRVGIRVLIQSRMDKSPENRYTPQLIAGLYHEAMDAAIAVYRYGDGPEDDQTLLGCLSPLNGKNDAIKVHYFGQMGPTDRLRQSMVDCWYEMELSNI